MALMAIILASGALCGQMPAIGIIDYYGLRRVSEAEARTALGLKEGDRVPESRAAIEARLRSIPGVVAARLNAACCDNGKTLLYVGIQEEGTPTVQFRPAPAGAIRLPAPVVAAGEEFEKALLAAVEKGDASEDDSQGHALSHNPPLQAVEERYMSFAARDPDNLRDVLRHSADGEQRALATEVLGYAPDKQAVVPDLQFAMSDPDPDVRNNAMRALALIAGFGQTHPSLGIHVNPLPFVALLNSLVWSDRNKAALALFRLSQTRDPQLLAALRAQALPALMEMAQWKSHGHAFASYFLLGRVAGLPEKQIESAWERNDLEFVMAPARKLMSAIEIELLGVPTNNLICGGKARWTRQEKKLSRSMPEPKTLHVHV
jgi:hypothetical protein